MLWKSDAVEVTQLTKIEQEIHMVVKVCALNSSWLLSTIYASPRLEERKLLWKILASISPMHELPWLMLGDFNEMLASGDKLGGNPLNPKRVQMFKDCLDSCGMVDLGFHEPRFTWVNRKEVGHFIQERLDRGFANAEWRGMYPEVAIHHLARTHSNHCPVLLKMDDHGPSCLSRPFQFQPM